MSTALWRGARKEIEEMVAECDKNGLAVEWTWKVWETVFAHSSFGFKTSVIEMKGK